MTPKEQYEARKAERKARAQQSQNTGVSRADNRGDEDFLQILDMADRFVTAVERIADALERGE